MTIHRLAGVLLLCLLLTSPLPAQENPEAPSSLSLEEIDRQLNNPLAKTWALVLQDNIGIQEGDAVDGTTTSNVLFFQPLLPVPVGEYLVFSGSPVFPLVTAPNVDFSTGEAKATPPGSEIFN